MNGSLDVQGTQQRPLTERIDDRIRSGDRHRHFSHSQRLEIKIQTTVQKIQKSGPTARESRFWGRGSEARFEEILPTFVFVTHAKWLGLG